MEARNQVEGVIADDLADPFLDETVPISSMLCGRF